MYRVEIKHRESKDNLFVNAEAIKSGKPKTISNFKKEKQPTLRELILKIQKKLDEHAAILNRHSELLEEHTAIFERNNLR